jgi:hypothetical protein
MLELNVLHLLFDSVLTVFKDGTLEMVFFSSITCAPSLAFLNELHDHYTQNKWENFKLRDTFSTKVGL